MKPPPTISTDYREFKIAFPVSSNPPTLLLRHTRLPLLSGCLSVSESLSSLLAWSIVACMKPSLAICHLFCTFTLQQNDFELLPPLAEPRLTTTLASRGLQPAGPRIWNSLPNNITLAEASVMTEEKEGTSSDPNS